MGTGEGDDPTERRERAGQGAGVPVVAQVMGSRGKLGCATVRIGFRSMTLDLKPILTVEKKLQGLGRGGRQTNPYF